MNDIKAFAKIKNLIIKVRDKNISEYQAAQYFLSILELYSKTDEQIWAIYIINIMSEFASLRQFE